MSLLLATPLAVRPPFLDVSRSRGVSMPFAAITYIVALMQPLPVFGPASSLYVVKLIPLTRLFSSTRISLATVRSFSFAPLFVASFKVMVGSYLAWIGQIGMQLVLPAQVRRFRYG